ncbi:hypothetical protein BASA81_002017 [Batrachochytrium salamandrivorans]|nr:hypothetical protein BASA81_002017 [Batrachochytrium salamandrivorans]
MWGMLVLVVLWAFGGVVREHYMLHHWLDHRGVSSPPKLRIALLVPVISTRERSEADAPLFIAMLPSLLPTLELDKYNYSVFLGFDYGDRLYDNATNLLTIQERFKYFTSGKISLQTFGFNGTRGAPCWVWNGLAKLAHEQGFDYFYQINDDLRFMVSGWLFRLVRFKPWTSMFISTLSKTGNIGVVGPQEVRNRNFILTQSFVHRTHYDIFQSYYPIEFKNWYSDDWITKVYGKQETTVLNQFRASNGVRGGSRYVVDDAEEILEPLVNAGREKIAEYKRQHQVL